MSRSIQTPVAFAAAAALFGGSVSSAHSAVVAPAPAGQAAPSASSASRPATAAQLQAVAARARALAAASNCEGLQCPQFDCPRMARQMQQLIDLETYLEAHLKALNAASGDYGAAYASLRGQSHVTQANLTNAQGAIILHRMLHDIGSALLDLASISSFIKSWGQMDELGRVAQADAIYEAAKDTESLLNTLRQNLTNFQQEIDVAGSVAPGMVDTLVAFGVVEPGATTAQVRQGLNDMISQTTDAINTLKDIKETYDQVKKAGGTARDFARQLDAKGSFANIGQMVGRIAKTVSTRVLEERRANEQRQIEALAAETGVQADVYLDWLALESSRTANLDALAAVREAKAAVSACLNRGCGGASFVRPDVPDFTTTAGGRTTYSWGTAATAMAERIAAAAGALDVGAAAVDNLPCPTSGGETSPPTNLVVPAPGLLPGDLRQTTRCPACQQLADEINRLRARHAFLVAEHTRIMADIAEANRLSDERNRLLDEAEYLNRLIIDGHVRGVGGELRVNIARTRAEADARLARVAALNREVARLRARGSEISAISAEIADLNVRLDALTPRLAACESRECPAVLPATDLQPRVIINTGVGNLRTGNEAGIGFRRTSGEAEMFAGRNAETVRMHILGVTLFPLAYREWLLSGSVLYGRGELTRRGEIEDGGDVDVGWPYSDRSPQDSTGLFLGNRAAVWTAETEAELLNFKLKMVHTASGPVSWFMFADYLRSRRDYDGHMQVEAFGDVFSQTRDQRVSDDLVGGGLGFQYFDTVSNRISVGGWTSAGLFHRKTSLEASERNVCPLCSSGSEGSPGGALAAPDISIDGSERDFVIRIDDEDRGLSWALAAGVYFSVPLSDRVAIGAGADVTWFDEVGAVFNPHSGDQVLNGETTRLMTTDALSYNFRIGLSVAF